MTSQHERPLAAAALLILALAAPADAAWFYAVNSTFQPRAASESHPRALNQALVMPHDAVRPHICVAYNSSFGKGRQGRLVTAIRITEPGGVDLFGLPVDPVVTEMAISGGVSRGSYLNCRVAPDLEAGDIVEFEHDFLGMPKLRSDRQGIDFAEVNGVVSDAGVPTVWTAPLGFRLPLGNSPNGLIPPAKGGWYHSTGAVFQADRDRQAPPKRLVQTLLIPEAATKPLICAGHSNMSANADKGKLSTTVRIDRVRGGTQTVRLAARVRRNAALACKQVPNLEAGDLVQFTFALRGAPRLARVAQTIEFAELTGAVSTSGEPAFREDSPPPPPPPPKPDPPPPPSPPPPSSPPPSSPTPPPSSPPPSPPPGGGGSLSGSDQAAAAKLLLGNTRVQLQRPRGDNPTRWLVVGPRTSAHPGSHLLVLSTAGVGNTIASAVADYERKMGSLSPASSGLNSADAAALAWYAGVNSSGGPAAIRRDGGGGYHGEFYRPSTGSMHAGPFGSIAAAAEWMRARGL